MRKSSVSIIFISMCLLFLSGCGLLRKKIDVTETLSLKYNGVDGHATAELVDAYEWEAEAFKKAGIKEIDSFDSLGDALVIESAVTYDISPNKNLSNGDEVTVTASIDEDVAKKYKLKLTSKEREFIVEGLPDVEKIDLFEDVVVNFEGIAPNVTASLNSNYSEKYVITAFTLDKNSGLDIGDVVTVRANYDKDQLLKDGYKAKSDTKEFRVENVSKYISSLEDIPKDADETLKKQTEDTIVANVAKLKSYSLDELIFLGNYFIKKKDSGAWGDDNCTFYIYQVKISNEEETMSYFYYVGYLNLILTEDNLCVYDFNNKTKPYKSIYCGWNIIDGYINYDEMFNTCITKNLENYTYENTVEINE